jgi:hypothetical protein
LRNSFFIINKLPKISQKYGILQIRDTIKESVYPEKLRRLCEKALLADYPQRLK